MKTYCGVLCLSALPLLAAAQVAPPDLSQLPPTAAASAPAEVASAPKRRCVAGCDGQSARVRWSEDAQNRFEEHRDARGELVKLYVHPKNGLPRYEVLVGAGRKREDDFSPSNAANARAVQRDGQAVWELLKF